MEGIVKGRNAISHMFTVPFSECILTQFTNDESLNDAAQNPLL